MYFCKVNTPVTLQNSNPPGLRTKEVHMGKRLFILFCLLATIAVLIAAFRFGQPITTGVPAIHVHLSPTIQGVVTFLTTPR